MSSGPARVRGNLICKPATYLIKVDEYVIIDDFDVSFYGVRGDVRIIIELLNVGRNSFNHVRAHNRIMCIGIELHSEEEFYEGVAKTYAHCVNEDVTWL